MNQLIRSIIAVGAVAIATPGFAQTAADALPGAKLYQSKCTTCHSLDANRIGPAHRGVFGRPAGKAPGYSYSAALKSSGIVWNATTLDQWLQGPQRMVKGTKMFLVVPSATDRAAIIAYLKATSNK
ncbi:c-type cytochrome [Sphingomonas sp. MMS24-J45]|uniref:c-type cytochrome n=1 Tax=Sphingomonas sp. MMS24-J45 TaxID=3238806 RepID=UPI00384D4800